MPNTWQESESTWPHRQWEPRNIAGFLEVCARSEIDIANHAREEIASRLSSDKQAHPQITEERWFLHQTYLLNDQLERVIMGAIVSTDRFFCAAGYVDLRQKWRCESRIILLDIPEVVMVGPVRRQVETETLGFKVVSNGPKQAKLRVRAKESVNYKASDGSWVDYCPSQSSSQSYSANTGFCQSPPNLPALEWQNWCSTILLAKSTVGLGD
ncbi:hypothetical protein P692DRAFT_20823401 [Suillus brevipes Sb2]|nr:hypothetical protein P692DRAFT_20823401 [Suillus brevipes Sb2]